MTATISTTRLEPEAVPADLMVRRFTVDEYHRMIEAGIITPEHRVELLEGWIVEKMSQNPPHSNLVRILTRWFARTLPDEFIVSGQLPVTLQISEPEPDLAILRGPDSRYQDRHPGTEDVLLIVEIADTSLPKDRGIKSRIYAGAKIPSYWIFNVVDRIVEVYAEPRSGRKPSYKKPTIYGFDEKLPLILDGKKIADLPLRELLK
jgi:putative restriction endonuclease